MVKISSAWLRWKDNCLKETFTKSILALIYFNSLTLPGASFKAQMSGVAEQKVLDGLLEFK